MTPERWAQVREVFEGALDRSESDRAAFLRITCAHDPELRREVDALLDSHVESSGFLTKPAVNIKSFFPGVGSEPESDYAAGYQLGPYVFERELGRGGMGSVWLAKRNDSDYTRRVAIKMVKRGMDSQEILRRFRMERQLLANLDHPNIATLLDGGSTPEGLPYLVMEYVEGTPIHKFCETQRASIQQRLELFRTVCTSVQYAHRSLVIHRDIKATNILVTSDGIPKLLDFGIAKLIRGPEGSSKESVHTRPDMRPMTLDYASPEQVRGENITTATDVYSLGVLLYRLLTGKLPFRGDGSRANLERAISEDEPLRPSLAVLEPDEHSHVPSSSTALVQERKRTSKELTGDLDNIILMAMRKEPHRRYDSVEQLAEDIQRYLTGRPVIARLDTPGYQLAKFVRRNAEGVAAALVVGAALITIAAVSSHYADIAQATGQEAERRNSIARHELADTTKRLGENQERSGDINAAKASYERAIEVAQDLYDVEVARGGPAMDTLMILAESSERLSQRLLEVGDRQNAMKYLQIARKAYGEMLEQNAKSLNPSGIVNGPGEGIDAKYALDRLDKKIAVVNSPPINDLPPQ